MKTLRNLSLLMLVALLAGCATTGPGGERSLILIDTATEIRMGAETDVGIRQEYPVHEDGALAAYVSDVGARVAAHSDRTDVQYSFTVLESEVVNAFAAPGGYIYVTTGLLATADDESELACVLAHEAGHVVGRHSVRAIQNAMGIQMAAELLLGDQGEAWGQLAGVGAGLFMMKNSREHEFQADQFAVKYAVAAGYDPAGAVRFFEKLLAMHGSGPGGFMGWLSTHPPTDERIVRAEAEIAQYDLSGHPRTRNSDAYLQATADLR
jgi:predicted Zn-dependent protease